MSLVDQDARKTLPEKKPMPNGPGLIRENWIHHGHLTQSLIDVTCWIKSRFSMSTYPTRDQPQIKLGTSHVILSDWSTHKGQFWVYTLVNLPEYPVRIILIVV